MPDATFPKPRRADAQRNRDAILAAARADFERFGVGVALDDVAKAAGVGNATLYRNFPTRESLVFELMRDGIAGMEELAGDLSERLAPEGALSEWLFRLAWHLRTWHGLPDSVITALNDATSPVQMACSPLQAATGRLLDGARDAGQIRSTIDAEELFQLITLLSWGIDRFGDDEEAARRRVANATAGLIENPAPAGR